MLSLVIRGMSNTTLLASGPVVGVDLFDSGAALLEKPSLTRSTGHSRLRRLRRGIARGSEWVFGAIALVIGLSVLAAMPIAQFLCLGYLFEASGRVGRSGRLRDGFVGVRRAARLGAMALGAWLWFLPLRLVASLARTAELIDPGGPIAGRWRLGLIVLTSLTALHIVLSCARGGRLRHFLWPFGAIGWVRRLRREGRVYTRGRDAVCDFLASLRLPYYFRLGLVGFLGTMAWLVVPVSLIAAGRRLPVLSVFGWLLLGFVALSLPFLQVRFATDQRLRAFFEYRALRERYRRAPWAFAFALFLTVLFALPLFLLKVEMIPRETVWLPSLVFLTFIFPARLLTGWAYHRSGRRETPRHWFFRGTSRLWMLPTVALYALFVLLSQFTAWRGVWSLYEQHAFLIPVPFIGL